MKLVMLARSPALYSHRRIIEAARERGHEIDVINTTYADVLTADSLDEHDQALWVLAENSR